MPPSSFSRRATSRPSISGMRTSSSAMSGETSRMTWSALGAVGGLADEIERAEAPDGSGEPPTISLVVIGDHDAHGLAAGRSTASIQRGHSGIQHRRYFVPKRYERPSFDRMVQLVEFAAPSRKDHRSRGMAAPSLSIGNVAAGHPVSAAAGAAVCARAATRSTPRWRRCRRHGSPSRCWRVRAPAAYIIGRRRRRRRAGAAGLLRRGRPVGPRARRARPDRRVVRRRRRRSSASAPRRAGRRGVDRRVGGGACGAGRRCRGRPGRAGGARWRARASASDARPGRTCSRTGGRSRGRRREAARGVRAGRARAARRATCSGRRRAGRRRSRGPARRARRRSSRATSRGRDRWVARVTAGPDGGLPWRVPRRSPRADGVTARARTVLTNPPPSADGAAARAGAALASPRSRRPPRPSPPCARPRCPRGRRRRARLHEPGRSAAGALAVTAGWRSSRSRGPLGPPAAPARSPAPAARSAGARACAPPRTSTPGTARGPTRRPVPTPPAPAGVDRRSRCSRGASTADRASSRGRPRPRSSAGSPTGFGLDPASPTSRPRRPDHEIVGAIIDGIRVTGARGEHQPGSDPPRPSLV